METLLRREEAVDSWSDDRLDELSGRVENGFAKVDREMNRRFDKVDQEMNRRFDKVDQEMNRRFDKVEGEMNSRFDKADRKIDGEFDIVRREFGRLNDRLDKLFWGIGFVGLTIGFNILADKV